MVTLKKSRDFYMEFKRQLLAGNHIRAKLLSDHVEDEILAFSIKVVRDKRQRVQFQAFA